jgi:hypothetical protein
MRPGPAPDSELEEIQTVARRQDVDAPSSEVVEAEQGGPSTRQQFRRLRKSFIPDCHLEKVPGVEKRFENRPRVARPIRVLVYRKHPAGSAGDDLEKQRVEVAVG